jgi:hypothetical protein
MGFLMNNYQMELPFERAHILGTGPVRCRQLVSGLSGLGGDSGIFGSGVAPFSPTQIPGLQLWLKADAGAYHDAGVTLATNGQTVQQWNDQSGNVNNASQSTGTNRPTFVAPAKNGKPGVLFDGSTSFMTLANALNLTGPLTYCVAMEFLSNTGGSYIGSSDTGCAEWYRIDLDLEKSAEEAVSNSSVGMLTDSWYAASVSYDGDVTVIYYQNGVNVPPASSPGGPVAFNNPVTQIGDANHGFANINLLEMLIYDAALNATQLASVDAYFNGRYAIH